MEEAGRGRRRLVVVGGGVAGALLAKTMQFDADVYLIDPKEYFEIPWADLRAKVEPSFAERSIINHTDYLTNGRLVTSSAIGVTERDVLTKEGRLIAYDYLVIATGHTNSSPIIRRDRLEQFLQQLRWRSGALELTLFLRWIPLMIFLRSLHQERHRFKEDDLLELSQ